MEKPSYVHVYSLLNRSNGTFREMRSAVITKHTPENLSNAQQSFQAPPSSTTESLRSNHKVHLGHQDLHPYQTTSTALYHGRIVCHDALARLFAGNFMLGIEFVI